MMARPARVCNVLRGQLAWGQKILAYQSAFMEIVQKQYGLSLNEVDFKMEPSQLAKQINDWVSRQNDG